MAGKGLLLILGLGAAVALTMSKKGAVTPATPANGLTPGDGKYDSPGGPVMPLSIEQTVDSELAGDTSIANLQELADSLTPMWPLAANALNARIAQLQAHPNPPAPSPPPAPAPIPIPIAPPVPIAPPAPVPPAPAPAPVAPPAPPTTATFPAWSSTNVGTSGNSIAGFAPMLPTIPGNYSGGPADLTEAVQSAINTWGSQVGFQDPNFQLTVDGKYGPHTQGAVGLFQLYVNEVGAQIPGLFSSGVNLPLTVDGLAGPLTQEALLAFGDMPSDSY